MVRNIAFQPLTVAGKRAGNHAGTNAKGTFFRKSIAKAFHINRAQLHKVKKNKNNIHNLKYKSTFARKSKIDITPWTKALICTEY
jgi:hypothetical protein